MGAFQNQRVLITGAASGIGRGMAERFAREGANLVLWDVNSAGLAEVQGAITAAGAKADSYTVDLTDRTAIYTAAAQTISDGGPIDVLINNAGIVSGKPLLDISDDAIERTFAVNTLALFWTTRAFLPTMMERRRGHIVTIASAGGIVGTARLTDYCASKFAAVGFDDSLRLELKRLNAPIHTTVVCPFYIDTGMFEGVKSRFGFLLPILKPDYVVRRIVKAVHRRKRRLIMPRFVYTVYPTRLLPVGLYDAILGFLGVNKTMDEFVGRETRENAKVS